MCFLNPSMVASVNWKDLHYIHKLLALVHCMVMNTFNETVNLKSSVAGNGQNLKPTITEELKSQDDKITMLYACHFSFWVLKLFREKDPGGGGTFLR